MNLMNKIIIKATPSFIRIVKKMHTKDKLILDKNIKIILNKPLIGEPKKGDLLGIFVYKFKINKQEYLLAYKLLPNQSNI